MTRTITDHQLAQRAIIKAADKILRASAPASEGDVDVAIMALFVAAASLARTQDMTRANFVDGAKLAYDEIHSANKDQ